MTIKSQVKFLAPSYDYSQQIRDNGEGMVLPKSYVGLKSHRRA